MHVDVKQTLMSIVQLVTVVTIIIAGQSASPPSKGFELQKTVTKNVISAHAMNLL